MRISDWSSDVCSSDLYEVNQVQSWPVKNSPLGALLDPDRDISRYAKLIPTDSRDVLSVEVKDPKRPEYGTITMVFVRDAASPRSEEHTSELQSLMRISYAVFCLKKKTKNNSKTNQTHSEHGQNNQSNITHNKHNTQYA